MSVKLKNGVRGIASLTAPTESISRHMPYGAAEAGLSGVERPPVRACTVCKEWAGHIPLPARDAGISNTIGKTAQERQRLAMTQGRLSAALTAHLRTESAGRTHQRALITLIGPLWPLDKQSRGFHTSRGCNRPGAGHPAGSQNAHSGHAVGTVGIARRAGAYRYRSTCRHCGERQERNSTGICRLRDTGSNAWPPTRVA
jgi:hypothetical protein